jgi:quercetin dioxygenase-like cupin family protein
MQPGEVHVVEDLRNLPLVPPGPEVAAVYDAPIGLHLLHEDAGSGEEHYLVRYPARLRARLHRHTAAHTIIVLDGQLDANGRVIGAGSYAYFPAGQPMRHQPAGDRDCLLLVMFHGRFDVEVLDGGGDTHRMSEPPLPDRGDSDTDEAWGDRPSGRDAGSEDDDRLKAERPPHYDR